MNILSSNGYRSSYENFLRKVETTNIFKKHKIRNNRSREKQISLTPMKSDTIGIEKLMDEMK